ncbi:MAG TPA: serine/threonine-protein kinase [Pyrinomonadaceae bacterium]|nr:serine/threonine-protein kinase [Pyrinomonadaceae bacterium]
MHAENWKTIKEVLLEALKLLPSERRDYLRSADITAETRAEVESLLSLEAEAEDFMSLSVGEFSRDLLDEPARARQRIGVYEIVSELGFGGMGAVYLATRADGKFEQRVAIKMLKREFNTEKIRRNFNREKEILATLAHPNIATLLDAGTTADGVPYLVMEYVKGEPIDKFCRNRKLSLNARLKLFNKVCDAVAFAHRNLIVHSDLKPSNILVNTDGEPKLLDFGISKLLDANADNASQITHLGALTPQYASPEQLKGEPVTTATDVYSLGIVLFKILTDSLPYHVGNRTNGHLLREIAEAEPVLPSEAARTPLAVSQLKGDLDNVILKALCKEPTRRYQSVEQFSADLWRFIDGLPVLARPATFSYRARKFYGRNRVSVWAAALIVISLCAGIGVALAQAAAARAQARIAAEAQRQAELETARARAEKQKAERTSRFMQSFLEYANPHWHGRGKGRMDVTVREAIDDAATRIDTELADEPEVRAELHYTVGEVYRTHYEYEHSFSHFRRSLDLYRLVHGDRHPKVARGIYYLCVAMGRTGAGIEDVEPLLRQAIEMMRETDPENVNLPYMLQSLAGWIMSAEKGSGNESRLADAESLILEAKTLFIRHYGEHHDSTITADSSLANLAHARGDLAREEGLREELVRRFREADAEYNYIWALFYLAEVKLALGKTAEAESLIAQTLKLGRSRWSTDDARFKLLLKSVSAARNAARK